MMPVRLLFLDRDGTINRTFGNRPPNTPQEVELLPGVQDTLARYAAEGWQLVIVTNQGGVAAGYLTEMQAHAVLQHTIDLLPVPVAAAYLCPHMVRAAVPKYALDCPNRKPRPGFILKALDTFQANPQDCLLIGDSITDRQAAQAANVPFMWADCFFGRPIERGMRDRNGEWVQLRQQFGAQNHVLDLRAFKNGKQIGAAFLEQKRQDADAVTNVVINIEDAFRGIGIEEMLLDATKEWA
ncbi:MAG: HAD-IIIA family hydrolase [Anaerolineae bacterium]|nr:HAD-IIIA family hydrolase [Anaerolineae bacterium]